MFEKKKLPGELLLCEMYFATEFVRLSFDCIWYLFFSIASLMSLESNAILIDLSCITVMTTGLMKTLRENLSSLMIFLGQVFGGFLYRL